jgi:hypothetical protein
MIGSSTDLSAVFALVAVMSIGAEFCTRIVIGIIDDVAGTAITNLEIDDITRASIDQVMRIAAAGSKSCAHPRPQERFAVIADEVRCSLQNEDKLILVRMGMPQARNRTGLESGLIDAEIPQTETIPQYLSGATGQSIAKGKWKAPPPRLSGDILGGECDRPVVAIVAFFHHTLFRGLGRSLAAVNASPIRLRANPTGSARTGAQAHRPNSSRNVDSGLHLHR